MRANDETIFLGDSDAGPRLMLGAFCLSISAKNADFQNLIVRGNCAGGGASIMNSGKIYDRGKIKFRILSSVFRNLLVHMP